MNINKALFLKKRTGLINVYQPLQTLNGPLQTLNGPLQTLNAINYFPL